MGFVTVVSRDKIGLLCGGRHHILLRMCEEFLQNLTSHGIKIAFYSAGPLQIKKIDSWCRRQNEKYEKQIEIFNGISEGRTVDTMICSANKLMSIMTALKEIFKKYGYFNTSSSTECDVELAQFASHMNAMAIIAQDSDLLIFEGAWQYWSAEHLNLHDLTTIEYSQTALRKYVFLSQSQLPLWATLAGNEHIDYDTLLPFLRRLGPLKNKFMNIARYIRQIKTNPKNMGKNEIKTIIEDCFGSVSVVTPDLLATSIKSYDVNEVKCIPAASSNSALNQLGFGSYELNQFIVDVPYTITQHFFDGRCSDFLPHSSIVLPLVLRQMGIALQHKNKPNIKKTILFKPSHNEPYIEKLVIPEYPTCKLNIIINLKNTF